jgi:hypothetical protein
MFTDETVI